MACPVTPPSSTTAPSKRVDFHRPAALQVLQHRGLVLAHLGRARRCGPLQRNRELHPQRLGDPLRLAHHGPAQRLSSDRAVMRSSRRAGQRGHIGLKQRLPHSFTQISSRMRARTGAFQPGRHQQPRQRLHARAAAAVGLAEAETVAVAVRDDAGLDTLRPPDRPRRPIACAGGNRVHSTPPGSTLATRRSRQGPSNP